MSQAGGEDHGPGGLPAFDWSIAREAREVWHVLFRPLQARNLMTFGKHDPVLVPAGAEAVLADPP